MTNYGTAIQLTDKVTPILNNIISAMNMTVSTVYKMQSSVDSFNASKFDAIYDAISQAQVSLDEFRESVGEPVFVSQPQPLTLERKVPDIFTNTGADRLKSDISDVDMMLKNIIKTQNDITTNAENIKILPSQNSYENILRDSISQPVEIPVTWTNTDFDVFTNTGVDRFISEIQSAVDMINRLNTAQKNISETAAETNIFSKDAVLDIVNIGNKMSFIQSRIQQIERNPANPLDPNASNELERLRQQLSQALNYQEQMNSAVKELDVSRANQLYHQLNDVINHTQQEIRDNVNAQGQFNSSIDKSISSANTLSATFSKIASAVGIYKIADVAVSSAEKLIDLSDVTTEYEARLKLNVDPGHLEQVKSQIYAAAQNSRADYNDTTANVSKLGVLAGDSFADTSGNVDYNQIIAFQELMNKNFAIGGASATEQASAIYQLTQAMAAGKLQGDEYKTITENAPLLNQAIEDYMINIAGVKGTMKEWAADGLLTADVIKNAVFSSADEINAKFETIPMTWAQVVTQTKNEVTVMLDPLLDKINLLANNQEFINAFNGIKTAFGGVINVALGAVDLIANGAIWISDNWGFIAPVILGVAAAIGILSTAMLIYNIYSAVHNGLESVKAARLMLTAAATETQAKATFSATVAEHGLNAALLASPVTWVVLGIIALIAVLFIVINVIQKVTGTTTSAVGMIFGAVSWLGAMLLNTVIGTLNGIIQLLWTIFITPFLGITEWILNVCMGGFDSFGGAVANLIGNVISRFLSLGKVVTTIIDAIFGTDWTSGLSSLQNEVLSWGKTENAITISRDAPIIDYRMNMTQAYNWGAEKGDSFWGGIKDKFSFDVINNAENEANSINDFIADNTALTASNTSAINDTISASSDEELEYLRKLAERETVNKFTTAEIKLDFSSSATLNSDMDIDGYINTFTTELQEVLVSTAEGLEK